MAGVGGPDAKACPGPPTMLHKEAAAAEKVLGEEGVDEEEQSTCNLRVAARVAVLTALEDGRLAAAIHRHRPEAAAPVVRLSGKSGDAIGDLFDMSDSALGSGTFGNVQAAYCRKSGQEMALKVITKCEEYPGFLEHLGAPLIRTLLQLRHENVVRYYHFIEDGFSAFVAMHRYTGPDLFDFFCSHAPLTRERTTSVVSQICAGLAYLHDVAGVVHCDVKPDNFIFATPALDTLTLIDFGSAYCFEQPSKDSAGSIGFCAPEVFSAGCSPASDVFSAGVIFFNCLTGDWPQPMKRSEWQEVDDDKALDIYIRLMAEMKPDAIPQWLRAALPGAGWTPLCELLGSMLQAEAGVRCSAAWARDQVAEALILPDGEREPSEQLIEALDNPAQETVGDESDKQSLRTQGTRRRTTLSECPSGHIGSLEFYGRAAAAKARSMPVLVKKRSGLI